MGPPHASSNWPARSTSRCRGTSWTSCPGPSTDRARTLRGARILVLGLAYKPNVADPRESPAFEVIDRLLDAEAVVSYHDPLIPTAPPMRTWSELPQLESQPLTAKLLAAQDAVLLITDHAQVDYDLVLEHAPLVVDTRGILRGDNVVRA